MSKLIAFFILITSCVSAQQTIDNFLQSAREDVRLRQYDQSLQYLSGKPWQLSPIQRLEIRTQTRELDNTKQEYALRVTPANPWEIRQTNQYFRSYNNMLTMERGLILQEAFAERYQAVIEYVIHTERQRLAQDIYSNVSEQVTILEKQIGSGYFDADDYIDAQLDLIETSADLHNASISQSAALSSIGYLSGKGTAQDIFWGVNDLISVKKIQHVVDSLRKQSMSTLAVSYDKEKIKLAQAQYKLEKSNINTGFVQAEYDQRRIEQQRTPINISLGVTIPIFNPNKGDMTRRKLDEFEAAGEMTENENENQFILEMLASQLSKNSQTYLSITEQLEKITRSQLGNTLSELKDNDPRVMVRFRGSTLKLKEVQVELYGLILTDYVEFLVSSGALTQVPSVNFLSERLAELR